MRYTYLLRSVAQHLCSTARWYDQNLQLKEMHRYDPDIHDEDITAYLLHQEAVRNCPLDMPLLFSVDEKLVGCMIHTPDGFFLLGPIRFQINLNIHCKIQSKTPSEVSSLYSSLPFSHVSLFCEDVRLLFNASRTGDENEPFLDENTFLAQNCKQESSFDDAMPSLYKKIFENVENSVSHNPYSHEKRQVAAIRNGNTDTLSEILDESFPGRYGQLSDDPLTQEIYIGIVATTLASRAAIEGGVHPEIAFCLSDITIRKLSECSSIRSVQAITRQMQIEYASLVHELKDGNEKPERSRENPHITRCKDYVFSHLHGKLTVSEIAASIGLEENYLSSLFKQNEGISLSSYIVQEKIKLAKKMLLYFDYSYIEISNCLGFASQSHFGQNFKKVTGMTPRAFRDTYAGEHGMIKPK